MHAVTSVVLIVVLGVTWGLNFSLIKFAALSNIPYALLASLTILGNLVIFAAVCWIRNGRLALRWSSWLFFAACGGLGYVLPFFLELFAVPRIGAGTLALVVSLAPIMTLILAWATGSEKLSLLRGFGIMLGFVSILPLMLQDVAGLRAALGLGLAVAVIVPFIYAIYHTLIDLFWPKGAGSSDVAFGESLAATALMVPIYALWPEADAQAAVPVALSAYWIVGALIALSALEVWLYFTVMRLGGAVYVSQAGYAAVLAGVIWGAVLFEEVISLWIGASLALVVTALFMVSPRTRDRSGDQESAADHST